MRCDFDVFEKFSDGSTLWRACVQGRSEAQRKVHELAGRSENEFFLLDIRADVLLPPISTRKNSRPLVRNAGAG